MDSPADFQILELNLEMMVDYIMRNVLNEPDEVVVVTSRGASDDTPITVNQGCPGMIYTTAKKPTTHISTMPCRRGSITTTSVADTSCNHLDHLTRATTISLPTIPEYSVVNDQEALLNLNLSTQNSPPTQVKQPEPKQRTLKIKEWIMPKPLFLCAFCRNNGEEQETFTSHNLKTNGLVTCPVLMRYVCPYCGAKGYYSHTRRYCPVYNRLRLNSPNTEESRVSET